MNRTNSQKYTAGEWPDLSISGTVGQLNKSQKYGTVMIIMMVIMMTIAITIIITVIGSETVKKLKHQLQEGKSTSLPNIQ